MKHAAISIFFILSVILSGQSAAAQQPNFSGTWALDAEKSFSNGAQFDQTMTIVHEGQTIKIEAQQKNARGATTIKEEYVVNGQAMDFTPQGTPPNAKGKRKTSWLANGQGILIEDEITVEGKVLRQVTRKWTMGPDSKTLVVDLFIDDQRGSFEQKRVFIKK